MFVLLTDRKNIHTEYFPIGDDGETIGYDRVRVGRDKSAWWCDYRGVNLRREVSDVLAESSEWWSEGRKEEQKYVSYEKKMKRWIDTGIHVSRLWTK
jgi:hypothetical protein